MGSRYSGSEREIRALSAYINLVRASHSVTVEIHREIADFGITERQLAVLEALFHEPQITQKVLAGKLLCTQGNLTALIDRLVDEGLVQRYQNSEDGRSYLLDLTDRGRKLISKVLPSHVSRVVEAFSALTSKEQEELRRLCRKLGRRER